MDDLAPSDSRALEAVDDFIAHIAGFEGFSPETIRAYQGHLDAYLAWSQRSGISALDPGVRGLRRYLAELKAARYAPRTIAAHLSAIRSFFSWAVVAGIVPANPADAVQMPKIPKSLPKTVSAADMRRLLEAPDLGSAEGVRDRAMLELFYATGARIAELSHLDIESFDLEVGTVRLFGKGSKERIVPMYRKAVDAVRDYLDGPRDSLFAAAGRREEGAGRHALFISSRGNRMDENALRYRFRVLCRKAGLPADVTPHVIRHTFATDLLSGGADLRSVQELLGHANLSTTTLYTHLTPDRLKAAVKGSHPRG